MGFLEIERQAIKVMFSIKGQMRKHYFIIIRSQANATYHLGKKKRIIQENLFNKPEYRCGRFTTLVTFLSQKNLL